MSALRQVLADFGVPVRTACFEADGLWLEALGAPPAVRAEILDALRSHRRRCDLCCVLEVMES